MQALGLAVEEERSGDVGKLELHERGELDAARRCVTIRCEAEVEDEED